MTEATKTKKTKVEDLRPPMELREITKARREWLAAKLAEVNARPGFEGKIVGNGSYQSVSVYSVTKVAGRLRHRGHCQFCGNSQVSDNGVMVLHGYSRPGIGYVFNECPAVNYPPLEIKQNLTEGYLKSARDLSAKLNKALEKAKAEHRAALNALYGSDFKNDAEKEAHTERPRGLKSKATPEEIEANKVAMAKWTAKFPMTARLVEADRREAELNNSVWRAKQQVEHFETLLGWKLLGKALIEEVVV